MQARLQVRCLFVYLEIEIDEKAPDLESRLHVLCRDLLSNPVIEDYEVQGMGAVE